MNLIIGTYTLPILREGFSWNENCGENGSHATSSVSLSVRPVDGFLTYLMTAEGNLSAVIKDGSTVVFSGVVRPYTGTSFEGNYQENISLEIMDYTEAMHIYIYPETTDGQKTGCIYPTVYQNKSLSDMVGILFGLGGKSISSSFTSTESIPYFKLEGEQYLDDVISELLFEYGYDYKWNAEGKAVIFPTFVDSVTVGTIDDVRGNFSISRSDDTTDGLKVTWREYEYQTNVPLYSFDSGNQTFNEGWEYEIGSLKQLTGKLYSGAMHDSHFNSGATMPSGNLWTWNFPDLSRDGKFWELFGKAKTDKAENTDSVLFVETDSSKISVSLYDEDGVTLSTTLESYDVNGMRMYVDYSGIFNVAFGTGWTWKVNVRGNIGTAVKSEASYNIIGANPDTKELKYRLGLKGSSVISENLVKQLYLRSKFSKISYSFSSLTSYDLGGFYTLEGNTIRIVSKVKNEEGIYTYRGEGAKAYSGVSLNVFSEQKGNNRSSSAKSAYDIAVDNGYTGSEEEWLASLDGVSTALLYLYKRSAAQPDSFDGGTVTYTFSTGAMSGSFGTWSSTIPTGTDALYFVLVRATGKGETYTVTSGMWSTPALMSESGSKGADGKTAVIVNIYQRATSSPATPSSVVTYSFADFTATGLGNWSLAIPAGANPLWVSQACAISTKESDVIESKEWATPRKVMENGESPVQIGLSSDSWIFPADCDGLVSAEEYAKLKIDVTAVKGSTTLTPALSVELTGITNVSVSGSSVVGSSDSIMVGDSASVKVSVVVEGKTYTKTVSIAKAKQSKATVLYFRWSKSETEFIPKDANSNFWIQGTSFIFFNTSLIGNIPINTSWLSNWAEIEALKDDEYCYLWCKTSEDGTPFLFTGATGKTGEYRKVMYALSESKTTAPTDGWTETMPDIVNSTQYLWYKEKIVPAGGNADEIEWSEAVVSAVGIAVTESKISLSADGSNLVVGNQTILLDAPNIIVPNTITANEIKVEDLMAQDLKVGKQIRSAEYDSDGNITKGYDENGNLTKDSNGNLTTGFYLNKEGTLKACNAELSNVVLREGSTIESDSLETSNKTETSPLSWTGTAFPTTGTGCAWRVKDVVTALKNGLSIFSTATVDGVTVYYINTAYCWFYEGSLSTDYCPKSYSLLVYNVDKSGFSLTDNSVTLWMHYQEGSGSTATDVKWVKCIVIDSADFVIKDLAVLKSETDIEYLINIGSTVETWKGDVPRYSYLTYSSPTTSPITATVVSGTYNGVDVSGYNLNATGTSLILTGSSVSYTLQSGYRNESEWVSSYSLTYTTKGKGVYVSDLFPKESGESNVGGAGQKFNSVYATNLYGTLNGDSSGTHIGNVNSDSTKNDYQVWGAVFN